jgi:copper chaperone NosL
MAAQMMSQSETRSEQKRSGTTMPRLLKWLPTGLMLVAAVLLIASVAFPYWGLVLEAPQYPGGLKMRVFVNRMTGDENTQLDEVREIDGLNHYIGMKSLYDAAAFERAIAMPAVIIMVALLVVAAFLRRRWAWLLALPAIVFPFVFLGDLAFWMNHYGQNLDPYAPLSSAIEPFTPTMLGEGVIGQFRTVAYVDTGWFLAVGTVVLVIVALAVRLVGSRLAARES